MIAVGIVITSSRKKVVAFGDVTYENTLSFAVLKKHSQLYKNNLDITQKNKFIGVSTGTSSALFAAENFKNVKIYDGFDVSIEALLTGKVDSVLFETNYFEAIPKETRDKIFIVPGYVHVEKVSEAFRKNDSPLLHSYNAFLKEWILSGKLDLYKKKYFRK